MIKVFLNPWLISWNIGHQPHRNSLHAKKNAQLFVHSHVRKVLDALVGVADRAKGEGDTAGCVHDRQVQDGAELPEGGI